MSSKVLSSTLTPLITPDKITETVSHLAQTIDQDYQGQSLVVVGVLKGSFMFLADLIRQMQTPIQRIEFMRLASYGAGTVSSGTVEVSLAPTADSIREKPVLLVEDIVDTGRSTTTALELLGAMQPASLKLCALLDKPARRERPVAIDYLGMTIPDRFIVGYGIDWNEQYRQLPGIFAVD
jgi:hypoxanthine phosphoribosyltransferase